ncbi:MULTISPECIES: NCS2 family permease [Halomonadaceae]|uniref:Solute carrier family 23 protein n=1 Tax=Modicisalibacter zincidurans TaxID=1178777 RepID=A0ABP9QYR7_9GAMM|nr:MULTISPECIES: NCS2 family permease [Halomonas]MCD6008942.1 NCS2 family permease [Halomonas sp. IOP_31]MEA3250716.1 NCS2 family permease [Pseudomonadota bacterium]
MLKRQLNDYFKLDEHKTTIRTEVIAGITTFLTMAYIIFVNPSVLAESGMDYGAVFVATCLAAAIGTLIMGLWANYPIALAPGMGLNAFFTYSVVMGMGKSWEVALGAVFLSGVTFFLLSIFRIREWVINSIPMALRLGIAAGIGLFLAIIALQNAGIVVDNPATLVSLGDLSQPPALYTLIGFFVIAALSHLRVTGAVMIGILGVTVVSILLGHNQFNGVMSAPPSLAPTFLELDIVGALDVSMLSVIFAFLFVDLFDTSGTLIGVAHRGGLLDEQGKLPRLKNALLADSSASMSGALLGTSTTTSYIESASGIAAGGRTGLTAVVVAMLFLFSLFFSPLAGSVPAFATAGALLYVAVLMAGSLAHANWDDVTEAAPVLIAALAMPLTYSIANGIALGFISFTLIKLLSGRRSDLNPAVVLLSVLFILKFLFLDGGH